MGVGRFARFKLVLDSEGNKLTIKTLDGCAGLDDLVIFESVPDGILTCELDHIFSVSSSFLYNMIGLRFDVWEAIGNDIGSFRFQESPEGGYTYQMRLGTNGYVNKISKEFASWRFSIKVEVINEYRGLGEVESEVELLIELIIKPEMTDDQYQTLIREIQDLKSDIQIKVRESTRDLDRVIEVSWSTRSQITKDDYWKFYDISQDIIQKL